MSHRSFAGVMCHQVGIKPHRTWKRLVHVSMETIASRVIHVTIGTAVGSVNLTRFGVGHSRSGGVGVGAGVGNVGTAVDT